MAETRENSRNAPKGRNTGSGGGQQKEAFEGVLHGKGGVYQDNRSIDKGGGNWGGDSTTRANWGIFQENQKPAEKAEKLGGEQSVQKNTAVHTQRGSRRSCYSSKSEAQKCSAAGLITIRPKARRRGQAVSAGGESKILRPDFGGGGNSAAGTKGPKVAEEKRKKSASYRPGLG